MRHILFIENDGTEHHVIAEVGKSVMQIATENLIPGVLGDCGGNCSCGTCHGILERGWHTRVAPATSDELAMIDGVSQPRAGSRLTCQILMMPELDGLVVRWPETQY